MAASDSTAHVTAALADVRRRVAAAACANNRAPDEITLIGVSKGHDAARIMPALVSGHLHFGENRVQEAARKWPSLRAQYPKLHLHLIGPLQTNKAHDAVRVFDVIHTLDRPRLAEKLAAEMALQNRALPCFVQVNTGREPQKAGVDPADLHGFVAACRGQWKMPVLGLMCLPPMGEQPALHFAFLRELARRNGLTQLSMGMSHDYETAIAFGATHVRVGTAIFGERA